MGRSLVAGDVSAQVAGLQNSNNSFSASPPGSMSVATNGVIAQKGVFEGRRGQQFMSNLAGSAPLSMTEFQNNLIFNQATAPGSGVLSRAAIGAPATPADFSGTFNPVDAQRMKWAQANDYLYFCCDDGPRALETYNGTPRLAGLLRMPDPLGYLESLATLSPGTIPYNSSVAFRTVLRKPTDNGTSLLSPPSGRVVVTNRILIPAGGLTRSGTAATAVPGVGWNVGVVGLEPGDTFVLEPGEGAPGDAFYTGTFTVTGTPTDTSFTFDVTNAGVTASTIAQDANTGFRSAQIKANLSADATTTTPVRLYRSVATSVSTVNPSDELFLSNEVFPSSGDITAGFVLIDDTTPASQLNDPLYTNPNLGGGAASANFAPPIYVDVAVWNSQTWYLNTTGLAELRMQMLGVGPDNGVQDGDTLTIDGQAFTFKTSPSAPSDVQITSNGLPAYNIRQTTAALIEAIFTVFFDAANSIRAYCVDPTDGSSTGNFLLQRTDYDSGFTVSASRVLSWTPALTARADIPTSPNGLSPSKLMEPEAVAPIDNLPGVGSRSWPGLRLLALKQSLLVCKGGDGIYAVTGVPGNYQTRQISTANCIAPDCAAVFADAAWVYTDQGILKVSDSGGCQVISRQIETELNALYAAMPADTYRLAFAVPYETERRIMFYVPVARDVTDDDDERFIMEAFCYSNATQSWTKSKRRAMCGVVAVNTNKNHLLVLGGYSNVFDTQLLTLERKTLTYLDDADENFLASIASVGSTTAVTLAAATYVEVGDGIEQEVSGTTWRTKILAVDGDTLTLLDAVPFTTGYCTVYKHFDVEAQFLPVGNPASRKSVSSLVLLFKRDSYATALGKATALTSEVQAEVEVSIPFIGFGVGGFGVGGFGQASPIALNVSPFSPSDAAQYFIGFKSSEVWRKTLLEGFALKLDEASGPAGRAK